MSFTDRIEMLLGSEAVAKLAASKAAVFGLGGVGSYAAEALARTGVGSLIIVDGDSVAESNINRQLCALVSTVGRRKTDIVAERLADINPALKLTSISSRITPQTDFSFLSGCDYCIDAIDDVPAKLALCRACADLGVPLIAAMGCGNRLDPTKLFVSDIYKTSGDPLCRKMRYELRRAGNLPLTVVCSSEQPMEPKAACPDGGSSHPPASCAFVPAAAGMLLASVAVRAICGI